MSSPTSKELDILIQFRERLNDLDLTEEQRQDSHLLRWIRARDHDLPKAEAMFRNSLKWRKDNDIDNLYQWEIPAHMKKEFPFVISGLDREGCPVGILPLGIWDVRKAVESGLADTYIKYVDHIMVYQFGEALRSQSPKGVTQIIVVFDMKGYSFRQVTSIAAIETIMETVKRFDLNHPETLKLAAVINAPTYFFVAYEIVKRVMSAKTLTKVEIYGANPIKWKPFLLKYIPEESLPIYLGGTNTDAQKVFDKSNMADSNHNGCPFTTATISAGHKLTIEVDVKVPDSVLIWSFKVHDHDIGFQVVNSSGEIMVPLRKSKAGRRGSHEHEAGSLQCKTAEKYAMIFDNSHSRFRSKTLEYTFHLEEPPSADTKVKPT